MKQCCKCERPFPATREFFYGDKRAKDLLTSRCKGCFHLRDVPPPDGYKRCACCKQDFPKTTEYFVSAKRGGRAGLSCYCKACLRVKQRDVYTRAKSQAPQDVPPFLECKRCGEQRPATEEYFPVNPCCRYGLWRICKVCAGKQTKQTRKRNRAKRYQWELTYSQTHKEHLAERQSRWYRDGGRSIVNANTRNRRARQRQAEGSHTAQDVQAQHDRQKGRCYWCKQKLVTYHVDHVTPLSRGGSNWPENLVIACPKCNITRNNRLPHEWPEGGRLL